MKFMYSSITITTDKITVRAHPITTDTANKDVIFKRTIQLGEDTTLAAALESLTTALEPHCSGTLEGFLNEVQQGSLFEGISLDPPEPPTEGAAAA